MTAEAAADTSLERAGKVARYKSAKYTVERPLLLGAALAGAGPEVEAAYSGFGLPLGEAFQLRDDVLGVFGDEARTGKPVGDDLREGKPTLLLAVAAERATDGERELLARVGDPELSAASVVELQDLLVAGGTVAAVEGRITDLADEAIASLAGIDVAPAVRSGLRDLAEFVVARTT